MAASPADLRKSGTRCRQSIAWTFGRFGVEKRERRVWPHVHHRLVAFPLDGGRVGVVEMAQALGLDVIAEGMENEAQVSAMKALGCPHGQGYALARPMPLHAALDLVSRGRPTARAATAPVGNASRADLAPAEPS